MDDREGHPKSVGTDAAAQRYRVDLDERDLTLTMLGLGPDTARLILLRVDCYLRPHATALMTGVESALRVTLPKHLQVTLKNSRGGACKPSNWHLYQPDSDFWGVQVCTLERILVQIAERATELPPGGGDLQRIHRVVCPLIEQWVDPVHLCALEMI